jgi:hypothetical protein
LADAVDNFVEKTRSLAANPHGTWTATGNGKAKPEIVPHENKHLAG